MEIDRHPYDGVHKDGILSMRGSTNTNLYLESPVIKDGNTPAFKAR